jgi:hypothetical protein
MAEFPHPIPMTVDYGTGVYMHTESGGLLIGKADKDEPASFNENVDYGFLEKVAELAMSRVPALENARIRTGWGGLYEVTPDHHPVIGAAGEPGWWVACGFSGHGVMHAPATGMVMAELLTTGRSTLDVSCLRLSRFKEGKAHGGDQRDLMKKGFYLVSFNSSFYILGSDVQAPGPEQRHMNIVFFGTSGFAVPALEKLLASNHRVMAAVTQPDRPAGRGQELHQSPVKEIALAKGLHLFQPENCNEYEFLRELRGAVARRHRRGGVRPEAGERHPPDGRVLRPEHPSVAAAEVPRPEPGGAGDPERRSRSPGVCIVKVVEKMDAGPILGITRVPVPPETTTPEMEEQLSQVGADLLVDVITQVGERRQVEIPQDEREASYAKKFEKNDGRIDWRKPAAKIQNFVRALIRTRAPSPSSAASSGW